MQSERKYILEAPKDTEGQSVFFQQYRPTSKFTVSSRGTDDEAPGLVPRAREQDRQSLYRE